MAELIKTRCTQGWLVITETAIIVELTAFGKTIKSESMLRSAFVDLDTKIIGSQLFGKKPATTSFKFYGQGNKVIEASLVNGVDAKVVIAILTGRE
jgi:hypothetical protein